MLYVSCFIISIIYGLFYCLVYSEYVGNKKFCLNRNAFFFNVGFGILNCAINYYEIGLIKPFLNQFYVFIMLKILYKDSVVKTLLSLYSVFLMYSLMEILSFLIVTMILKIDPLFLQQNVFGYIMMNILIMLGSYGGFKLKFIQKLLRNVVKWYAENQRKSLTVLIIIAIFLATFILYQNFVIVLPTKYLLMANIFFICVMIFVIGFFFEKSNNNRISTQYDQLLDYVKTYEKLVEEKSKAQHEYKNQLILIRELLPKRNVKIAKYISELLEESETEYNYSWMNKLKNLPQGGLKGLIYYKIQTMEEKGIKVFVEIKENVQNKKIFGKNNENLQDVSKVLGVYIDNAIEAASQAKEKYVVIEVYYEKKEVIFKISNTYDRGFDLTMIDKEGYTTKGKGKGYGLSLVKDILSKNNTIRQNREFNGKYYVQYLFVKVL